MTILGVRPGERVPAFVVADSELERSPLGSGFDTATEAGQGRGEAAGVESLAGVRSAEVAVPIPQGNPVWIAVFSESLAGGRGQRRPDQAPDPDRRGDRPRPRPDRRLLRGAGAVAPAEPARGRRPEGRRRRLRDPDPGRFRRRAGAAGADLQRDAAPPRRPRQRPQAVHRQRLARAADADLLARGLRRAARGRGSGSGRQGGVRAHDAPAGRAADQADHRPARPLAARRRRAGGLRRAGRPRRDRPGGGAGVRARPPTGAARGSR